MTDGKLEVYSLKNRNCKAVTTFGSKAEMEQLKQDYERRYKDIYDVVPTKF